MDKIKEFFQNKIVKAIAWILLFICAAVLIIGGVKVESISAGIALTAGIITAVSALIAFIASQLKK